MIILSLWAMQKCQRSLMLLSPQVVMGAIDYEEYLRIQACTKIMSHATAVSRCEDRSGSITGNVAPSSGFLSSTMVKQFGRRSLLHYASS